MSTTVYKNTTNYRGYSESSPRIRTTRDTTHTWLSSLEAKGGTPKIKYSSELECDYHKVKKIEIRNNTSINIKGITVSLPEKLSGIKDAILDASYILDLKEDWDENAANATNINTFKKAVDFAVTYSTFILNNYGTVIDAPHIDILRDGSISAFWETKDAQFLIIFKKDDCEYSYFYGEEKNASIPVPFNRAVKNGVEVDAITALWMFQKLK